MPVIKRNDGVQFAVYTYRELLTAKKASLLKQEIQILQKENGNYCRFFSQPNGDYEAVFSREEGYLLAETVWEYFGHPFDLLYCEIVPNSTNAILIVVRAGSIYLDVLVPLENLQDEFATLVTGTNQYDIYITPDIPLSQVHEEGKFTFDDALIKSFKVLDVPLFPQLKARPIYKLLPVAKAMEELSLGSERVPLYLVVIVLVVVLGVAYWILKPSEVEVKKITNVVRPPPKDPYAAFKSALTTPSPDAQLLQLAMDIRKLFTMPGWVPTIIKFDNRKMTADIGTIGGTTEMLLAWSRANDINITVVEGRAKIELSIETIYRAAPTAIYNIRDVVTTVFDRIKQTVPEGQIVIMETIPSHNYIITSMDISFTDITTDTLMLFGSELQGLPINLENGNFNITSGLLTGKLRIQVVGAKS